MLFKRPDIQISIMRYVFKTSIYCKVFLLRPLDIKTGLLSRVVFGTELCENLFPISVLLVRPAGYQDHLWSVPNYVSLYFDDLLLPSTGQRLPYIRLLAVMQGRKRCVAEEVSPLAIINVHLTS